MSAEHTSVSRCHSDVVASRHQRQHTPGTIYHLLIVLAVSRWAAHNWLSKSYELWMEDCCNYRQHCAQHKPPVFSLFRGRFSGFSPRSGDWRQRCNDGGEICHGEGDLPSPSSVPNFTPIGATTRVYDPKNWNCYSDL